MRIIENTLPPPEPIQYKLTTHVSQISLATDELKLEIRVITFDTETYETTYILKTSEDIKEAFDLLTGKISSADSRKKLLGRYSVHYTMEFLQKHPLGTVLLKFFYHLEQRLICQTSEMELADYIAKFEFANYLATKIETGFKKRNPLLNTEFALKAISDKINIVLKHPSKANELKKDLMHYFKTQLLPRIKDRVNYTECVSDHSFIESLSSPLTLVDTGVVALWVSKMREEQPMEYWDLISYAPNFGLPSGGLEDIKFRLEYLRSMTLRDNFTLVDFLSPFNGVGPTAKGLALIAHYHQAKYRLSNPDQKPYFCFVFGNLDDFAEKLLVLGNGPDVELIIELVSDPGHRLALCFQRKQEANYIVIMDSLADSGKNTFVKDLTQTVLNVLPETKIIACKEQRQFADSGCGTFTAKDAVKMGTIPNFYDYVINNHYLLDERFTGHQKFTCPPSNYSLIQSLSQYYGKLVANSSERIPGYLDRHPEAKEQNIHHRGQALTLDESIKKSTKVKIIGDKKIEQNTKVEDFTVKYIKETIKLCLLPNSYKIDRDKLKKIVAHYDGTRIDAALLKIIHETQHSQEQDCEFQQQQNRP